MILKLEGTYKLPGDLAQHGDSWALNPLGAKLVGWGGGQKSGFLRNTWRDSMGGGPQTPRFGSLLVSPAVFHCAHSESPSQEFITLTLQTRLLKKHHTD